MTEKRIITLQFVQEINLIMSGLYIISGIKKVNEQDALINARLVAEEIVNNYARLELDEIAFALQEGAKGRYGDYQGINLKSVIGWLDAYLKSPERLVRMEHARQEQMKGRELPEGKPMTEEQRMRNLCDALNEGYKKFIAGTLQPFGFSMLRMLMRMHKQYQNPEVLFAVMKKINAEGFVVENNKITIR